MDICAKAKCIENVMSCNYLHVFFIFIYQVNVPLMGHSYFEEMKVKTLAN